MTDPAVDSLQSGWPYSAIRHEGTTGYGLNLTLPLVSLVTPSYNQASFLHGAVLSVLGQDYPNMEYLVFDGGSTDGSTEILERHGASLTYWESQPDEGQAAAINKGWRRSQGEYLWWLNADDMLTPGSIRAAVRYLEANPGVDLVYGDLHRIDAHGRWLGRYIYPPFSLGEFLARDIDISQAGGLMRRHAIDRIGYLDEGYEFLMDKEFWLRLALSGGQVAHLSEPLAFFRIHSSSKTQQGSRVMAQERRRLIESVMEHPRCPVEVIRRREEAWSNAELHIARDLIKSGHYPDALRSLAAAVGHSRAALLTFRFWINGLLASLGRLVGWRIMEGIRALIRRFRRVVGRTVGKRPGI